MKRDMGLIRELLLRLEGLDIRAHGCVTISPHEPELTFDGYTTDQVDYHMALLYEAGLITSGGEGDAMMSGDWIFRRLTFHGHDFVDSVRDPEIWRRTKEGASKLGGASLSVVWEMAKAYGKHVAKERLGLDL